VNGCFVNQRDRSPCEPELWKSCDVVQRAGGLLGVFDFVRDPCIYPASPQTSQTQHFTSAIFLGAQLHPSAAVQHGTSYKSFDQEDCDR